MSTGTAVDVVMPQMGVSVSEGTITRWLKQVGDHVEADETIVEISTDKVDTEVPSPGSGTVTEILVPEGETVDVGTRIAVINGGVSGDAPAPAPVAAAEAPAPVSEASVPPAPAPVAATEPVDEHEAGTNGDGDGEARSFMSPVVARMVSEHALDIGEIPGTGRGGRVTKKDVEQFLESREGGAAQAAAPRPRPRPQHRRQLRPRARPSRRGRPPRRARARGASRRPRRSRRSARSSRATCAPPSRPPRTSRRSPRST